MNKLREERQRQKLSQFQLSLKSGVWASKISWIENNHWNPSEVEKIRLSNALNVSVSLLFPPESDNQEKDRR